MTLPDAINGGFELFGGVMQLVNCKRLYLDKQVRGVSLPVWAFFTTWGVWNIYYYPHLDQWLSFAGGLVICGANMLWLLMALYYKSNEP